MIVVNQLGQPLTCFEAWLENEYPLNLKDERIRQMLSLHSDDKFEVLVARGHRVRARSGL